MKKLCTALVLVCLVALPLLAAPQSGWEIIRADYGSGNNWVDVTDRVRSLVQGNSLNFRVDGNALGAEGRRGRSRALRLQLKDSEGRTRQITYRDRQQVNLQVYTAYYQSSLQINRAIYGAGNRTYDVTSRLNSQIQGDQLNLQVNNSSMGGDPAPGQAKTLTVQYALNGRTDQVVVNEGDMLRLPYGNSSELSQRIRCESVQSNGYGRKYCATNTRGGVRLIRQIGESACTEGSSWGYDDIGVWVDNGCRGEFKMRASGHSTRLTTTIPNGTELSVRTNERIDSQNATVGQQFSAVIAADVLDSSGVVTIPRGSDAELVIRSATGGSITSASDLVLDVNSIMVGGTRYLVSTDDLEQQGGQGVGANRKTVIMVGGGAAVGTLIGAIVGGGKGAAIGAAVGAGAGLGTEVLTKGKQVRVPAETLLSFRLDQDLRLHAMR